MKLSLALFAIAALLLAACDTSLSESGAEPPDGSEKPRPPAVSPLDVPIETSAREPELAVNADAETLSTSAYAARGNEPYWSVAVSGNTAVYLTAPDKAGRKVAVNRLVFAEGVEYVGVLDGLVFAVNFRGTDCADSLTGEKFPMTAAITVHGETYHGCAVQARPAGAEG